MASGSLPRRLSARASSRWMAALLGASSAAFASFCAAGVDLLLPQEQQAEVGPARRLVGHERGHAVELLARQHLLARLQRGEAGVERRHRLAVRGLGHSVLPRQAQAHARARARRWAEMRWVMRRDRPRTLACDPSRGGDQESLVLPEYMLPVFGTAASMDTSTWQACCPSARLPSLSHTATRRPYGATDLETAVLCGGPVLSFSILLHVATPSPAGAGHERIRPRRSIEYLHLEPSGSQRLDHGGRRRARSHGREGNSVRTESRPRWRHWIRNDRRGGD